VSSLLSLGGERSAWCGDRDRGDVGPHWYGRICGRFGRDADGQGAVL